MHKLRVLFQVVLELPPAQNLHCCWRYIQVLCHNYLVSLQELVSKSSALQLQNFVAYYTVCSGILFFTFEHRKWKLLQELLKVYVQCFVCQKQVLYIIITKSFKILIKLKKNYWRISVLEQQLNLLYLKSCYFFMSPWKGLSLYYRKVFWTIEWQYQKGLQKNISSNVSRHVTDIWSCVWSRKASTLKATMLTRSL